MTQISRGEFPHCLPTVLHSPKSCIHCDQFPELQQERTRTGTNFTGENNPSKHPCPAQLEHSEQDINKWHGNRPEPPERVMIYKGSRDAQ